MSHGERDIRETLSGFYQELHQRWKKAEELLLSFRVPAAVSVRIKTVQPAAEEKPFLSACHHDLGFVKHYGRWGICYGLSSDGTPGSLYWMSIHHCSAEQQVEAAACFPSLLTEVTQAATKYSHTVQEAMSFLQDALPDWPQQPSVPAVAAAPDVPVANHSPVVEAVPPQPAVELPVEAVGPVELEESVPAVPAVVDVPVIQTAEPETISEPLVEQIEPAAVEDQPETLKVEPAADATTETAEERKEAA